MPLFILAGLAAAFTACLCIYLASLHQRWLAAPWPPGPARIAGVVLLGLSCLSFTCDYP